MKSVIDEMNFKMTDLEKQQDNNSPIQTEVLKYLSSLIIPNVILLLFHVLNFLAEK